MAGTPGRFWVRETSESYEICGGSGGVEGALGGFVQVAIVGDKGPDAVADAFLLAAAPRLRSALKALLAGGDAARSEAEAALRDADGDAL